MPNYGSNPPQNILAGLKILLFNNEVPAAGTKSIAFVSPDVANGLPVSLLFTFFFSNLPTTWSISIYGSLNDVDSQYQLIQTITGAAIQNGYYVDQGLFTYYRLLVNSWTFPNNLPQGTLLATVSRS